MRNSTGTITVITPIMKKTLALFLALIFVLGPIAPLQRAHADEPQVQTDVEESTSTPPLILPVPSIEASSTDSTSTPIDTSSAPSFAPSFLRFATISSSTPETDTITVSIRDGATLVGPFTVALPAASAPDVSLTTTDGSATHTVSARSVLALLATADTDHDDFQVSDLGYYDGFGSFLLNCIDIPSAHEDCFNWTYAVDGNFPSYGMDQYSAQPGDRIYIFFGSPWQIGVDHAAVNQGEPVTATASLYDPASGAYVPAEGFEVGATQPDPNNPWSPLEIATATADAAGHAVFTLAPGTYNIGITESFYYPTAAVTVSSTTATSTGNGGNGSGGNSGGSGGNGSGNTTSEFNIASAFSYLRAHQSSNGSFGDILYTDWGALALALPDAPSSARTSLKSYMANATPSLDVLTDYERHALALEALGINPYTAGGKDWISPIVSGFDGSQFGSASEVNDDMFALPVLLHAGYTKNDPLIQKSVASLVSQQSSNGMWQNPDLTAAGIQVLRPLNSLSGVSGALTKAENYLRNTQNSDGSFGTDAAGRPDTTSWTLQAIAALGDSPSSWSVGANTPLTYLASVQQSDGSISSNLPVWSTEYALSAAEGVVWNDLLQSFAKPAGAGNGTGSGSNSKTATTTTATSTSTSTPVIAVTATSTATTVGIALPPVAPVATPVIFAAPGSVKTVATGALKTRAVVPTTPHETATTDITASSSANTQLAAAASTPAAMSLMNGIAHFFGGIWHWIGSLLAPFM